MAARKFLYLALLWTGLGVGMIVFDLFHGAGWFTLMLGPIPIPLGIPLALYGVLNGIYYQQLRKEMRMTDEEVRRWAGPLEEASPEIWALLEARWKAGVIAERIERTHGIPSIVTLKFLISLGDVRHPRRERSPS